MVETVVGRALQSVLQRVSSAAQSAGRAHKVRPTRYVSGPCCTFLAL